MENAPTNKTDIKKMIIKQLIVLAAFAVLCLIEYVLFPLILPAELGELLGDHILFFVLLAIMYSLSGNASCASSSVKRCASSGVMLSFGSKLCLK